MSIDLETEASKTTHVDHPPNTQPAGQRVSKTVVNFWIDVALLIVFAVLLWASAILQIVFPPHANAEGWMLWGGDIVYWRDVQFILLCILSAGITVHVMLHWTWVCGVLNKRYLGRFAIPMNGTETLVGVGLVGVILFLLGVGVLIARLAIQHP